MSSPRKQTSTAHTSSAHKQTRPARSASSKTTTRLAKQIPLMNKRILIAAAIMVVAILMISRLATCSNADQPYDAQYLSNENGRFVYQSPQTGIGLTGVDVSSLQGSIDWYAVASDDVDFAFIRLGRRGYTEGNIFIDDRFEQNLSQAQAAGLKCGVYFYSQATTDEEALEEAKFVVEHLKYKSLELPVVFDHEIMNSQDTRTDDISSEQLSSCAHTFCDYVKGAGFDVMIYGNKHDLARYDEATRAAYPLWFARYNNAVPDTSYRIEIWQYSHTGTVKGISTNVDLNLMFNPSAITATSSAR